MLIFFLCVLNVFGVTINEVCYCKFDSDIVFGLEIHTTNAGCPNTPTGKITINQLNASEVTISYTLKGPTSAESVNSISNTFQVIEGTYLLTVKYTNTTRVFDFSADPSGISYDDCSCNYSDIVITSQYETIGEVSFTTTPNPHCAGSFGEIQCGAKVSEGNVNFTLAGTEDRSTSSEGKFEDLPVGTYRCVAKSTHCVSQSPEIKLNYSGECTDGQIWIDRQIYGEGKSLFIAGIVLICLGIILNIAICCFCCKLIIRDRKPERIAKKKAKKDKKKNKNQPAEME